MSTVSRTISLGLAGLLLAACSGGATPAPSPSGLSATAFASQVCTQLGSFNDDVRTVSNDTAAAYDPKGPLKDKKAVITDFLKKVGARTRALIDAVDAIGVPAIDGGQAAADKVTAALAVAKAAEAQGLSKVEQLPTTGDPKAFDKQANAAGSTIQTSIAALATAISNFGVPALDQAFRDEPACTSLSSGGA